jgi:threonyl-tRNA synthetase
MRLLFVHADRVAFEATTAVAQGADADEPDGDPSAGELTDCVAAFVGVESADATPLDPVVADAAGELKAALDRLNARRAFLSPAGHLVDDPAAAETVRTALRGVEAALDDGTEVLRAPAGWHLALDISAKGHPFARRSVRIDPAGARDPPPSEWRVLGADGGLTAPAALGAELDDDLRAIVDAEKTGTSAGDPGREPDVDRLREHGLTDRPSDGDEGIRWLPRGTMLRDALAAYAADLATERGATPVETPDDSRRGGPQIPGDASVGEPARPVRRFEAARERPELRAAIGDAESARAEFRASVDLALRASGDLGLDARPAIRATRAFYDHNEAWIAELADALDAPVPVGIQSERRGPWSLALDLIAVDADGRGHETAAVRLDLAAPVGDDSDADRSVRRVRCAPVGRLDRAVEAVVASATRRDPPGFPTWLAPTQVRLVPVGDEHVDRCEAIADELGGAGIRVDIDDRERTVGRRLADAASDWVPYYAVIGDRELGGGALDVTVSAEATERSLIVPQLRETVLAAVGEKPRPRLSMPRRTSRWPRFADRRDG